MYSKLIGFGYELGSKVCSNEMLSKVVDTNDEWIYTRTGIKQRHFCEEENTSDLGAKAVAKAITNANISKSEIDMIICATFTPDHATPSCACLIQAKLGLQEQKVMAFDINAACSGFLYALQCADAFIASGMASCVAVVGAEVISKHLDWEDRGTCIIFGDGAGAVIVQGKKDAKAMYHYANAKGDVDKIIAMESVFPQTMLKAQALHTTYLHMEGKETFRFAISAMQEAIEKVLEQAGVSIEEIDYVIPHQANARIIQRVMKQMQLSKEQVVMNIEQVGNTSAASIPIALAQLSEQNKLRPGMKIVLCGFGAGFTWAGSYLQL